MRYRVKVELATGETGEYEVDVTGHRDFAAHQAALAIVKSDHLPADAVVVSHRVRKA